MFLTKIEIEHIDILKEYSYKNISVFNKKIINYFTIENITSLKLNKLHSLNLEYSNIIDVSAHSNVHTLNLRNTGVIDISSLGNVHTLDLRNTKVTDV